MSQITSIYDTAPGSPIYTDLDLNGEPCGGYRRDLNCVQWIPLPSVDAVQNGTSAPPQLTEIIELVSVPDHPTYPPITQTPEPHITVLMFGAILATLLWRSIMMKGTTK